MTRINKGIRFEYKIRDEYKKYGYYVIRSAGSRGFFDLIAIHPQNKHIVFIQLKRGSKNYLKYEKEKYKCDWVEGYFTSEFKLIEKQD